VTTNREEPERQCWDSCLFIDFITDKTTGGSRRSRIFKQLVAEARAGRSVILLSNLVLAEVRPRKARNGEHRELLEELLEANRLFVQFYAVTRKIALRARDEGAKYSLSVCDAVHVATALEGNASVLFTYDGYLGDGKPVTRLLALDRKIGKPPLRIELPTIKIGPLFEGGKK
jgi:predicted nucleic acid-binding protein